jgi:phage tail-like protein
MPPFTVNPHRLDPYKNFKFRVVMNGRAVAGVSRISALRRVTEVVSHREGLDLNTPRLSPGVTTFDPIILERGVSHDTDFEAWANEVFNPSSSRGNEIALASFRRDIRIELFNEAGQLVIAYQVRRAWVSEFVALSDLDAASSDIAFQSITLQHEGWERDTSVVEPAEPRAPTPPAPPAPHPPNNPEPSAPATPVAPDTDEDGAENHPTPPTPPELPPRFIAVPNNRTSANPATTPKKAPASIKKAAKKKVIKKPKQ